MFRDAEEIKKHFETNQYAPEVHAAINFFSNKVNDVGIDGANNEIHNNKIVTNQADRKVRLGEDAFPSSKEKREKILKEIERINRDYKKK